MVDGRDNSWRSRAPGPHTHRNTARQAMDGLWTEVCGQQKQSNDPGNNQHNPQYANYWAPLTRKRHILPHSAQPRHTNHWAPRTRKRDQQEHRPQRPTEHDDPTQHAKGRPGDRPGPRKETTTRRNVTQGGGWAIVVDSPDGGWNVRLVVVRCSWRLRAGWNKPDKGATDIPARGDRQPAGGLSGSFRQPPVPTTPPSPVYTCTWEDPKRLDAPHESRKHRRLSDAVVTVLRVFCVDTRCQCLGRRPKAPFPEKWSGNSVCLCTCACLSSERGERGRCTGWLDERLGGQSAGRRVRRADTSAETVYGRRRPGPV